MRSLLQEMKKSHHVAGEERTQESLWRLEINIDIYIKKECIMNVVFWYFGILGKSRKHRQDIRQRKL